jgi:hypothetical protein
MPKVRLKITFARVFQGDLAQFPGQVSKKLPLSSLA